MVEDIRAGGATSLRAIAAELNGRGMLTRRGGRWHVSTVMNLLGRREAAWPHRADTPLRRSSRPWPAIRRTARRLCDDLRRGEVLVVQWQGQLYLPGVASTRVMARSPRCTGSVWRKRVWRVRIKEGLGAFLRYLHAADLDL